MTSLRITTAAALMAAYTATAFAVSPSPPEQPTAGNQGDRTNQGGVTPPREPGRDVCAGL